MDETFAVMMVFIYLTAITMIIVEIFRAPTKYQIFSRFFICFTILMFLYHHTDFLLRQGSSVDEKIKQLLLQRFEHFDQNQPLNNYENFSRTAAGVKQRVKEDLDKGEELKQLVNEKLKQGAELRKRITEELSKDSFDQERSLRNYEKFNRAADEFKQRVTEGLNKGEKLKQGIIEDLKEGEELRKRVTETLDQGKEKFKGIDHTRHPSNDQE